ncbi:MAG: amidohydrolase family protein [Bdellovibrionales bacterium]|nr:amidohydrolase family protein [Bdellovibrionales bacterium]
MNQTLQLASLTSAEQVLDLDQTKMHYRGDWLIGFGWDENKWASELLPHRSTLDQAFGERLVSFSRADGHAAWVSTSVLQKLGWLNSDGKLAGPLPNTPGGKIVLDDAGVPTGVVIDAAKTHVDHILPKVSSHQMNSFLLSAIAEFHKNGITHIRDMSCSELQWNETLKLEGSGLLKVAIEQTFSAETPDQFDKAYDLAQRAMKVKTRNVKPVAMKVYYDGALGSEGALLSEPYKSGSGVGLKLLTKDQVQSFLKLAWEIDLALAVHTIGDLAVKEVVEAAIELWDQGLTGDLHLEHAQLISPETLEAMKGRPIKCFMQPCHYLSDKSFLKSKLTDRLLSFLFPYKKLEDMGLEFYFGSDTPIEPPEVNLNYLAMLEMDQMGVPRPAAEFELLHSHPDRSWIQNCHSKFVDGKVTGVSFDGEMVI